SHDLSLLFLHIFYIRLFFFHSYIHHLYLHSFPTRRSSDLMIGTIPSINGEGIIPPSSLVSGLFGRKITTTIMPQYTRPVITAAIRPFLALGSSSSFSSSRPSPLYFPRRGSSKRDVSSLPIIVSMNTEIILKYQLSTGVITIVSTIRRSASVEITYKRTSVPAINKIAVKPAPAPAKPAARPASGCLPNL